MIESYTQTGGIFIALDAQGLAVGYLKPIGGQIYPETLKTNPHASREVNPKVDQRIQGRLDRHKKPRKEVAHIRP